MLNTPSTGTRTSTDSAATPRATTPDPGPIQLTADAIEGFTLGVLASRYDQPKPIPQFHREMWALCCSPHLQVSIAAPRGHAKSTAITFAYVMAELFFRTSNHVLVISANESLAAAFLHDIRVELEENELLGQLFGPFQVLKDSETELIVQCPDKHRWRVVVKGSGQRMRGLKWERKRPDLVVGDDLEDDEIVLNEERREKFRRWFYGAVRPITRGGGRIRLVGTIIHLDSLLERTMPGTHHQNTRTTGLKIWSTTPQKGWMAVKYEAHNDDFSEILWPAQASRERLQAIRKEFAEMGMLDVYGQEYRNQPIDESTAYFRRQDFLPMTEGDRERRKIFYVGGDLAISEKKKAAYTCFVVGGVDEAKCLHIVDVRRGHWDTHEIIEELFSINSRWQPALIRMESENIEKAIRPVLDSEMVRRQTFLPYDTGIPGKDKQQRARAFQFRMRAGNVKFDKVTDWYAAYEEEVSHFPKWRTLDQVDASAWLGMLVADELTAPTEEELYEDEYQQMRYADSIAAGASAITGY